MKFIKLLLIVLLLLSVLLFIVVFAARTYSKRALPDYNENIALTGLTADVEVYRDTFAIPHVYAENEKDLYTAVGYLMAQDRLWQMDLLRRVTLGRLSEIFGNDFVETDHLLRSLQYSKKSEELLKTSDENIVAALEAFSNGVNQFIEANRKKLPVEFTLLGYKPEPWEPVHSLNLIGYMAWDLKAGWSEFILEDIRQVVDSAHIAELIPDVSVYKTFVFPEPLEKTDHDDHFMTSLEKLNKLGVGVFEASNNWAVSGFRSETGKPLLANDMHLGFNIPGIWYQMHQVVRGKLNVTGLVLPGQPLVICGHNDSIAWGMTNTYVDNVDFYREKVNPDDSSEYLYMGEWRKFERKKERISTVKGDTIEKEIVFSHRGPVISEFKGVNNDVITMHWTGDEPSNEMETVYRLNRASNWDEFKDAVQYFKSISQNIVFADVQGNIGLYCSAGVPIRKRDILTGILPGWTDEYDWKGMVPFDELPHSYNPAGGSVSSANNKTAGEDYPYHIGIWYSTPYRIDRIRELLDRKEKLGVNDFKAIQLDQKSEMAATFLPSLTEVLKNADLNELEEKSFLLLKNWDGEMGPDAVEPSIFDMYYQKLIQEIFLDEMGPGLFNRFLAVGDVGKIALFRMWQKEGSVWFDNISTKKIEIREDVILSAFKATIDELGKAYGPEADDWKWGNIHQFTLEHPVSKVKIMDIVFNLNRGPYPVGGSFHTVSPYSYPNVQFGKVNHGSSHRHIYCPGNWDESLTVIPTGNSGIPLSKNYCDQTEMYVRGEYHPDLFSEERVKVASKYKMTFTGKN